MSSTKNRVQAAGPHTLKGSQLARKSATVILEALTGLRSTQEAADAMGIALARYYVLETRALQGFICALEPRARGRQRTSEHDIRELKAELALQQRELLRYQALHRSAQRALGVPQAEAAAKATKSKKPASAAKKKKTTKRRRKQARGERILRVLKERDEPLTEEMASHEAGANDENRTTG